MPKVLSSWQGIAVTDAIDRHSTLLSRDLRWFGKKRGKAQQLLPGNVLTTEDQQPVNPQRILQLQLWARRCQIHTFDFNGKVRHRDQVVLRSSNRAYPRSGRSYQSLFISFPLSAFLRRSSKQSENEQEENQDAHKTTKPRQNTDVSFSRLPWAQTFSIEILATKRHHMNEICRSLC